MAHNIDHLGNVCTVETSSNVSVGKVNENNTNDMLETTYQLVQERLNCDENNVDITDISEQDIHEKDACTIETDTSNASLLDTPDLDIFVSDRSISDVNIKDYSSNLTTLGEQVHNTCTQFDSLNSHKLAQNLEQHYIRKCHAENMNSSKTELSTSTVPGYLRGLKSNLSTGSLRFSEGDTTVSLLNKRISGDDLFSAFFENVIGDSIVEDNELEWDHSPDTDIKIRRESEDTTEFEVFDVIDSVDNSSTEDYCEVQIPDLSCATPPPPSPPLSYGSNVSQSGSFDQLPLPNFVSEINCTNLDCNQTKLSTTDTFTGIKDTTDQLLVPTDIEDSIHYYTNMGDIFTSRPRSLTPPPSPPPVPQHPAPSVNASGSMSKSSKKDGLYDGQPLPPPPPPPPLHSDEIGTEIGTSPPKVTGAEPMHWPAPPLEMELPPFTQSVAQVQYKSVTSPTESKSFVMKPPANKTLTPPRNKSPPQPTAMSTSPPKSASPPPKISSPPKSSSPPSKIVKPPRTTSLKSSSPPKLMVKPAYKTTSKDSALNKSCSSSTNAAQNVVLPKQTQNVISHVQPAPNNERVTDIDTGAPCEVTEDGIHHNKNHSITNATGQEESSTDPVIQSGKHNGFEEIVETDDMKLDGVIPVGQPSVVTIPVKSTISESLRNSYHPETAPKPLLSSFSNSTLPRRTKSLRYKKHPFDNLDDNDNVKDADSNIDPDNIDGEIPLLDDMPPMESVDYMIKKTNKPHKGIFASLGLFTNSPLLKRTGPPSGPKRVIFQLPKTHKDNSDAESVQSGFTVSDTDTPKGSLKDVSKSSVVQVKEDKPVEVQKESTEKPGGEQTLANVLNAHLLRRKKESDTSSVSSDRSVSRSHSSVNSLASATSKTKPETRPKSINIGTKAAIANKRHTIATATGATLHPPDPNGHRSSSPIGGRPTPPPTVPSPPGPPMLQPVRPPRMAQLQEQRESAAQHAANHTPKMTRKKQDGTESDDSYFSDSEFEEEEEYCEVHNMDDDGVSQTSDFTSYSDDTMTSELTMQSDLTLPRSPSDRDARYDLVCELLKTEKSYVERLRFLCRVVLLNIRILNKVQDTFVIPGDALNCIFNNIEQIYDLHTGTILPRIENRVENWRSTPRFGDVMKELLKHLSAYTTYVENFNNAMTAMTDWTERCPVFNRLLVEVEKTPECRHLKVKQHMLEVVQRVPKYLSFFKDYANHLSPHSDDHEDTIEALTELSEFAQNLERAQGKDGRMRALKSVQARLDVGSTLKIYSPLRELVKEGKIKSISPKTAKKLDRYIFLMNDMLLTCTTSGLGGKHKLKYALQVDGLQVYDGDNLVIPFTFYVQNKTKAIEFHSSSDEEKKEWMSTIQNTIDKCCVDKLRSQPVSHATKQIKDEDIGKIKPKLVKPNGKPFCAICRANMKKAGFCKACGTVVCSKCCSQKVRLAYDSKHKQKVCDECYILVVNRDLSSDPVTPVQNVRPSDPCQLAGYLQVMINKSQNWKKRWLAIHDNGILYSFKNFKDQTILGCLQLKRYIALATMKGDDVFKPNTLKLFNARRTYYLQADNGDAMARWLDALAEFTNNH